MKRYSYKFVYKFLLASCLISAFSCKKLVDVKPEDQVDIANHYQNVYDANAAVIGIYGQLQGIADRYIVLNELRADLVSPTINADQYLKQLNTHNVTADNPWIDPKPFYRIILNCNDALKNFEIMLRDKKLTTSDYQQRYSDVGAIRSWLYLQLAIQFGNIPYVTDPLEKVEDLKDTGKFPRLTFDQVLDKLVTFVEGLPYKEPYAAAPANSSNATSLNTTVDGYPTNLWFINKQVLLGDLYLWHGDYTKASALFVYVANTGTRVESGAPGNRYYDMYKITNTDVFNNITYSSYQNELTLRDDNTTGWRGIFGRTTQDTNANIEWIWTLPFDRNFAPVNPFIDLFSNQGGKYLLTASKQALDNWAAQTQGNGLPYDARGLISVRTVGGQPVIMKPLYTYLTGTNFIPGNILQKQGRWLLYRGATLILHLAESANRDNRTRIAYALTNVGIKTVYNGVWPGTGTVSSDVTNIMQTPEPVGSTYYFDAREGSVPSFRGDWYRSVGIRNRANLLPLPSTLATNNDPVAMENALIDEDALELAFEGHRWQDLMRIAHRRGDPSFVANKVYNKLVKENNPAAATVLSRLSATNGLYLPFNL